jgi:hypothetical protein
MKNLVDRLEDRRLLSTSLATLTADFRQIVGAIRTTQTDVIGCIRTGAADAHNIAVDLIRDHVTRAQLTPLIQLITQQRSLFVKLVRDVIALDISTARDGARVYADFALLQRVPSNTLVQTRLQTDLAELSGDAVVPAQNISQDITATTNALNPDFDAVAAIVPSDTRLQADVQTARTDVANCLNTIQADVATLAQTRTTLDLHARAHDTVFSDKTFTNTDWELATEPSGNGGTVTAQQVRIGGFPGAFREVSITLNAPDAMNGSQAVGFSGKLTAIYSPQTAGAIASVDFGAFAKMLAGQGLGHRVGVALRQNGKLYYAFTPANFTPELAFTAKEQDSLTAADFSSLADEHPDFSAAGGAIEFGFFNANSAPAGSTAGTRTVGIDNWTVIVHPLISG